jgi:hypothetical protein
MVSVGLSVVSRQSISSLVDLSSQPLYDTYTLDVYTPVE